jgi:hypothetical protein
MENDLIIKFLFSIIFVAIVVVILYYGITDKQAQSKRLYAYIFSIVIPLLGIMLYLKDDMITAGMRAWWYISIFLGGLFACFVVILLYYYMPTGSASLLIINFIIYVFLFLALVVGLAIIYNIGQDYFAKQTGMFAIWIQVFFYIPCLMNDFILYVFQEFSIIPNMVFVLFVIEIILVLIYIYGPDVANMIVTEGGMVLLPDYRQLNLMNTIAEARQFKVQDPIMDIPEEEEEDSTTSCLDINGKDVSDPKNAVFLGDHDVFDTSYNDPNLQYSLMKFTDDDYQTKSNNPGYNANFNRKPTLKGITDPLYVSTGPTDPSNNSCKFNPYLVMDPLVAVKCGMIDINDISHPKVYNQSGLYNSISKTISDSYIANLRTELQPTYNTNYAIAFWAYLNPKPEIFQTNSEYNILNYSSPTNDFRGNGGNPKITFLNDSYNVYFSNNPVCQSNSQYESKCMYKIKLKTQKWNYFVFNYSSGQADLFVNGILEKTYKFSDNPPVYSNSDQITIGEKNGAYGYICNVLYYRQPLTKSQIAKYYNILSVRNPPLIKL